MLQDIYKVSESFNKEKLRFMERFSDFDDVKEKINMIRNLGIKNINKVIYVILFLDIYTLLVFYLSFIWKGFFTNTKFTIGPYN